MLVINEEISCSQENMALLGERKKERKKKPLNIVASFFIKRKL